MNKKTKKYDCIADVRRIRAKLNEEIMNDFTGFMARLHRRNKKYEKERALRMAAEAEAEAASKA